MDSYRVTQKVFSFLPVFSLMELVTTELRFCRFQVPWAFAAAFVNGALKPWFHPGTEWTSAVAIRLRVCALELKKKLLKLFNF